MPETTSAALHVDHVVLGLQADTRDAALAAVATLLAGCGAGPTERAILAGLTERDRTASTAWGNGIAVPHARIAGLTRPFVVLARLAQPVDFCASDGKPVDLFVAVLTPQDNPAEHIRILARLARRLRDPGVVATLRTTSDRARAAAALDSE